MPTSPDTLDVRRQLALALLDTAATFGPYFAASALIPIVAAAAGAGPVGAPQPPPEVLGADVPDQIRAAAADLMPRAPEAARLARERVLPQLLAAVLPGAGQGQLGRYVRTEFMAADTPAGRWVLEAPLVGVGSGSRGRKLCTWSMRMRACMHLHSSLRLLMGGHRRSEGTDASMAALRLPYQHSPPPTQLPICLCPCRSCSVCLC